MKPNKITIGQKIIGSFSLVMILLIIMIILSETGLHEAQILDEEVDHLTNMERSLTSKIVDHHVWVEAVFKFIIDEQQRTLDVQEDPTRCKLGQWYYGPERQLLEEQFPEMKPLLNSLDRPHQELHKHATTIKHLVDKQHPLTVQKGADVLSHDILPVLTEVQSILKELRDQVHTNLEHTIERMNQAQSGTLWLTRVTGIAGLISGIIGGLLLFRNINGLLLRLVGDLSHTVDVLAASSEEIASSSQMLSSGASQQAASLEETSSSMEEISIQSKENVANASSTTELMRQVVDMVKQTATNAETTAIVSNSAKLSAENGVQSMGEIARAMREIREGSEKITDIIEVINEITHQTKMLATNAAIEAARAGDQGKGFAVVADEVSKLAENSKKAAKEIAGLIRESVRKAEAGNELAQKGEVALQEILKQSRQVSDLIETISSAATEQSGQMVIGMRSVENIRVSSEEQANGVEQINRALVDLDKVTQSNAANAEETASASEELSSQAMGLRDLVEELSRHVGTMDQASAPPVRTHTQNKIFKGTLPVASLPATTGNKGPNTRKIGAQQSIAMRDDFKEF
ncbi:MAG: CZB domain-containing protein [SAR324 cluster bacterium]|nr:CZB domain-containing protein [SAR324 cluster bacterium]